MGVKTSIDLDEILAGFRRGFHDGEIPSGVFGRFGRLRRNQPEVEELSSVPGRLLAWLLDADALQEFVRLSPREMIRRIGKSDEVIDASLAEGQRWYLLLTSAADEVKRATWMELILLVAGAYPQVADRLRRHPDILSRHSDLVTFLGDKAFDEAEASRAVDAPGHLSTDVLLNGADTPERLRIWLWHEVGLNHLFRGDGYSYNQHGRRGEREYVTLNRPIDPARDVYGFIDVAR